jgi:hypothetical protein
MSDRVTATGSFLGTGAALSVTKLGFRPRSVRLFNVAAGGLCSLYWNKEMPDASGFKEVNHDTAQRSFITSNGITPLANGFQLGADADLNAAGELVYFEVRD